MGNFVTDRFGLSKFSVKWRSSRENLKKLELWKPSCSLHEKLRGLRVVNFHMIFIYGLNKNTFEYQFFPLITFYWLGQILLVTFGGVLITVSSQLEETIFRLFHLGRIK